MRLGLFAALALVAAAVDARQPRRQVRSGTIRMKATAYCDHGKTKSGAHTRDGIVAVDPRKFPLGTRLQIVAPGKPYAGIYTVMDTGPAVRGRALDIFMPSCRRAKAFGRRTVSVRAMGRPAAPREMRAPTKQ